MIRQYRTLLISAVVVIGLLVLGFAIADLIQPQVAHADGDDRINCHNASPIAIYCDETGVTVYSVVGEKLLFVSRDALDAVGTPDVNTPVGEGANLVMYVLDTGEFQINYYGAKEMYVAIWTGCHIGAADIIVFDIFTGALISDDEGCDPCVGLSEWECTCGPNPGDSPEWNEWLQCYCAIETDAPLCRVENFRDVF